MSQLLLNLMNDIKKKIKLATKIGIQKKLLAPTEINSIPDVFFEFPNNKLNGNLSTNYSMISAKIFKLPPKKIAEIIKNNMDTDFKFIYKIEIAGAGFLNFFFKQEFYNNILNEIYEKKTNFGKTNFGNNKKINLEFISANPTGPMHLGNARLGAYGDFLSEILKFTGFKVQKEFYINDAGNQIEKFGTSLICRLKQELYGEQSVTFPEDGYHGEDIRKNAQNFIKKYSGSKESKAKFENLLHDEVNLKKELVKFSLNSNIKNMQNDLKKYNIFFDEWFNESQLYKSGEVQEIIKTLKELGHTYEKDGAVWYKATNFDGKKDEVLVRKNGIPTYFAADIAYHKNKFKTRNFETCIDIWGADHHGHIARMKGAMDALGINSKELHIILVQLVRLTSNGETLKMSKRSGKSLSLSEFLNEVSSNSAKFIFNTKDVNSPMDFDLELIKKNDLQNPVYYIQYAYARIHSIIKNYNENNESFYNIDLNVLNSPEETDLIFHLAKLGIEMNLASKTYNTTIFTNYLITLATLFHKFYNSKKVITDDKKTTYARIFLCKCTAIVLKNLLDLVKIDTPEKM